MLYHINTRTGNPGKCSAKPGNCPYGTPETHFTSPEAARAFYESNQETVLRSASKARTKSAGGVATVPTTGKDFQKALMSIPSPEDSSVISPPAINDNSGYLGGSRYVGAERAKIDTYIGQTEAAAGIRDLVRKAKLAGEIPQWIDVSVKKNAGAWVSSIAISVGYKPEGGRKVRAIPNSWIYEPYDPEDFRTRRVLRPGADKLQKYISVLGASYESSDINSMVDYFNSSNAGRFSWRDPWEDKD